MASSSVTTWLVVGSLVASLALMYSSAWLHGTGWFAATILSMGVFFGLLCGATLAGASGFRLWVGAFGALLLFGLFFYIISARHVTRTRLMDLTYQSHDAVTRYISEKQIHTPLARVVRVLGPALLAAMGLLTLLALAYYFGLTGDL